jgi:dienelactone hydrolase
LRPEELGSRGRILLRPALAGVLALTSARGSGYCQTPYTTRQVQSEMTAAVASGATRDDSLGVRWVQVQVRGMGTLSAAVARSRGNGPFPAIVILHGSHGFAREYVDLARAFARGGFVAIAGCWFSGRKGAGTRFITPIECPDAPPLSAASSDTAFQVVDALVRVAREQPNVRADRVALFGHSRGGGAALEYVLKGGVVHTLILNSAGYPEDVIERAAQITAPALLLHGTADSPADGGSAMTSVERARLFEAAVRRAGRSVESKYYPEGRHNGIFSSVAQQKDELRRSTAFLRRHLRD